jgi:non-specific serine/threonine protein kinase
MTAPAQLALVLTPHGRLALVHTEQDALPDEVSQQFRAAFSRGSGHGLLQLGAETVGQLLPPVLGYWREFAARYLTMICTRPDVAEGRVPVDALLPPDEVLEALAAAAPAMTGAEYLGVSTLRGLWGELDKAFHAELLESKRPVQEFLHGRNPAWRLVGRVHFNLAENRKDEEAPFAFLATYTTRLSTRAKAQHLPLGRALEEYAGAAQKPQLLSLLLPVQRASEQCPWLKEMVDTGDIYHPLRWSAPEAFQLLTDVPKLEASGVIVRVPGSWSANRPPRPQVSARVGGDAPAGLGANALLDFQVEVTLDGETLTSREIQQLLAASHGLQLVRGRWVEVDGETIGRLLDQFRTVERSAESGGLTFAEAMRLLAGADVTGETPSDAPRDWSRIVAGPWLADMLASLRHPDNLAAVDPGTSLKTGLRPYQQVGLRWLHFLSTLGLGACLADDMGLGKTVQVLALLLAGGTTASRVKSRHASLLVAPASLLANWSAEIARFSPSLRTLVAHPSVMRGAELKALDSRVLNDADLVITSYGSLSRIGALTRMAWRLAILDEAQAIKNPAALQTRTVKQLDAHARIALTGTPVENRLADLWSIFDFINPGLLGTSKEFTSFTRRLAARTENPYRPLRELVRPYILRRLKTDKAVITDLPDKTEVKAFCHLTRVQAALYQQAVQDLSAELARVDGMKRKGAVLASLMRFKQICNHPSHWLGDERWAEEDSGKWARLRDIMSVISARQEKVLVFTQFREITAPLAAFLSTVFGRTGLVLHGGTEVGKRQAMVRRFQHDEELPFFVLSLKAGGVGLNLTAASHVVHFDRWWNPAVENQATDRAFRIGQTRNVLVHKFLCRGTVEEKIDRLIESKQRMSQDLLEGGAELLLTEMNDDELLKLVALDVRASSAD